MRRSGALLLEQQPVAKLCQNTERMFKVNLDELLGRWRFRKQELVE